MRFLPRSFDSFKEDERARLRQLTNAAQGRSSGMAKLLDTTGFHWSAIAVIAEASDGTWPGWAAMWWHHGENAKVGVYVRADARRFRVGSSLVDTLRGVADALGMTLRAMPSTPEAKAFYRSAGVSFDDR